MPRCPRIDFPGAIHHVYGRGIEKRDIFRDDDDRKEFRLRIKFNLKRAGASCLAWAFLPNHFHLLFHSREGILSTFMHRLMSGYSLYFNRKHKRAGHLFQNRFRSSLIRSERYLLEAIRYIHLNPVRAGLVRTLEELAEYPWSGHRDLLGSVDRLWPDMPFPEEFFGGTTLEDRKDNYLRFLEMGLKADPAVSFSDGSPESEDEADFRKHVEFSGRGEGDGKREEFLRIAARACRHLAIPPAHLWQNRRNRISTAARRLILKECCGNIGIPMRDVCAWLGITHAGGAYLLRTSNRHTTRHPGHEKF